MTDKRKITYLDGDAALLDEVKPLWEQLNMYHLALSKNFKHYYMDMTFPKRKIDLLKKAASGKMHVDLAIDEKSRQKVGYCISSVTSEKTGEIKSIFVIEDSRGSGIGDVLMRRALCWMDSEGAVEKIVEVASGNEKAWEFYGKYGFLPRKTMLKQVKKP